MQIIPVLERVQPDKTVTSSPEVYYPERDGKPLSETDWHTTAILLVSALCDFRDHLARHALGGCG